MDRAEWHMTPQTVNAYYNPAMNEVVFPAAILQPPFFTPGADDAVNYAAIGAVIGHEIGHGFDDQGSAFDGTGKVEDWWTEADREAFRARTKALIAQYDAYRPASLVAAARREGTPVEEVPHVNGALTIDPHSPAEFRCNGIVRNVDAFYEAFGVGEGDALWLAPEERVTIW